MQTQALDLRKGYLVDHQGRTCTVIHWNIWKSDRRSRVQMRLKDLLTGRVHEVTAQGDDRYDVLDSEVVELEHSYREGNDEVFYTPAGEEYRCPAVGVEEQLKWKCDRYKGLLVDSKLVTIELPPTVVATVVDTSPPMKGSGQTGTKDAMLDNGVKVRVGMIVANGDKVRLDPETLEYKERA
jgi:translation elongation factor P/translation initiation factor 5A